MKHARQKWLSFNFTRLKDFMPCKRITSQSIQVISGLKPFRKHWETICDLQMNHARSSAPSRAGQGEENILRTFAGCTVLTKNSTHRLQLAKFPSLGRWVYHKKHPFYSLQPHHSHLKVEAPIAVQATKETRAAKAFPPRGCHDAYHEATRNARIDSECPLMSIVFDGFNLSIYIWHFIYQKYPIWHTTQKSASSGSKKITSADEDALKLRSPWAIYAKENE